MMVISGIGSNCHYFAYESALEDSFELNVFRKMKNGGNILRYNISIAIEKAILREAP